jgi:tetratricopeptide (TPR) repeat protein
MSQGAQIPDPAAIRDRLRDTFSPETLRHFCRDRAEFRPILDYFGPKYNLHDMIDEVITYCDKRHLWEEFLAELDQYDPSQYALPAPYQAPRPLAEFVGREDELQHLTDTLQPGTKTAITCLVGMGGLGKTELAKLAAAKAAGRFRDGVLWADCGQQDLTTIADLWAAAYGKQLPGDDAETKASAWRGLVSTKEALLIFDNVQPGQEVEPLFPPMGRSAILLTTRHADHPALRGAGLLCLDQFTLDEASALAVEVLGEEEALAQADDAARLFDLVGYLPLGIAVALHLADDCGWPLGTVNGRLEIAGALKVLGDEKALHTSLNATFELAWANLPKDLKKSFGALALFNPGSSFSTLALAETLDAEEADARAWLNRLARRSLLTAVGEGRWSLHALLRQFAATRPPTDAATRARHARHYEGVAREANDLYLEGGGAVLRGLGLFDLEWPHIEAGQAWAAEQAGTDDEAARLCSDYPDAGRHCLSLRLHPRQRIAWLEAAVQASHRLRDKGAEGVHLGDLGLAYADLGKVLPDGGRPGAIEYYEQALAIAQEMDNREGEGAHLGNLGSAYYRLGKFQKAIDYYKQALAIAQEMDDWRAEGTRLGSLGNAYAGLDDVPEAINYYEQALAIVQEMGDQRAEGTWLGNLGSAYHRQGKRKQALQCYEQQRVIARAIGDRHSQGNALLGLGNVYADVGKAEQAIDYCKQAIDYYKQALEIASEIDDQWGEANALANLGLAYRDLGEPAPAGEYWTEALALYEAIEDPRAEQVRRWLAELGE